MFAELTNDEGLALRYTLERWARRFWDAGEQATAWDLMHSADCVAQELRSRVDVVVFVARKVQQP